MGVSPAVSIKPPAIQHSVVALHTQGVSKRKIAQQLGMSVNTVMKILNVRQPETEQYHSETKARIIPKAFQAIEKAIDTGDANIAMRYLERTALSDSQSETLNVHGDVTFQTAVQMLPGTSPSTTDSPGLSSTPSSTGTEAAAKTPGSDTDLACRTNFSTFSLAQLEQQQAALTAELERRRAQLIEAEVTDAR